MSVQQVAAAVVMMFCAAAASAQGSKFNVNCTKGEKINALLKILTKTASAGPITITVIGTCKESVSIQNFDRLTLMTKTGAVIDGPSKNVNPAVLISQSHFVTLEGFTIRGGVSGIWCLEDSVCNLNGLTIQNATEEGVVFARSEGIASGDIVQNNGFRGYTVKDGGKLLIVGGTILANADSGAVAVSGANLTIQNATIQSNGVDGIRGLLGSAVRLFDNTITGNGGNGVSLFSQSNGSLEQVSTGNLVIGNAGNGIAISDLSFARFLGTNNVSANVTQPDVACYPQYSATRGVGTTEGTTNCSEPAGLKPVD